jgi:hypothetical protein
MMEAIPAFLSRHLGHVGRKLRYQCALAIRNLQIRDLSSVTHLGHVAGELFESSNLLISRLTENQARLAAPRLNSCGGCGIPRTEIFPPYNVYTGSH